VTHFIGNFEEYSHNGNVFKVGEKVWVAPISPNFEEVICTIIQMSYSNCGFGPVHALVSYSDHLRFHSPIKRMRKL